MITSFQRLMVLAILILGMSGFCWAARSKTLSSRRAKQDAARNRIMQQLSHASGPVKLVLRDHTRVKGQVAKTYSDRLTLQTVEGDKIVDRTIRFDQVKKISYIEPGHPYIQLVAGNVAGSGILAIIILAAVGAL